MKRLLVLCAAVALLLAPVAWADFVQPPDQVTAYFSSSSHPQVMGDDVTPSEDGVVSTIRWHGLYTDDVQPAPGVETFTMRLFDDAGGLPGSLMWEENASVSGVATGNLALGYVEYEYSYSPAAPFSVFSGITTWLSVFSDDDNFCWESSNSGVGGSIVFTTTPPFTNGWAIGGNNVDLAMHLVIVPEPGTFLLLGLGGISLALYRRRKKQAGP